MVELLRKQIASLDDLMEAAEKAGPFQAMNYAKRAAALSRNIINEQTNMLEALEKRVEAMESKASA